MKTLNKQILKLQLFHDTRGQELLEYALVSGFIACACGAALPDIGSSVLTIFSKVMSVFNPLVNDGTGSSPAN